MTVSKSKRKSKARRPVARGPQMNLPIVPTGPEPKRNARVRFVEPPPPKRVAYDKAMPFYAVRVPAAVRDAFIAKARKQGKRHQDITRKFMSRFCGVALAMEGDRE